MSTRLDILDNVPNGCLGRFVQEGGWREKMNFQKDFKPFSCTITWWWYTNVIQCPVGNISIYITQPETFGIRPISAILLEMLKVCYKHGRTTRVRLYHVPHQMKNDMKQFAWGESDVSRCFRPKIKWCLASCRITLYGPLCSSWRLVMMDTNGGKDYTPIVYTFHVRFVCFYGELSVLQHNGHSWFWLSSHSAD